MQRTVGLSFVPPGSHVDQERESSADPGRGASVLPPSRTNLAAHRRVPLLLGRPGCSVNVQQRYGSIHHWVLDL